MANLIKNDNLYLFQLFDGFSRFNRPDAKHLWEWLSPATAIYPRLRILGLCAEHGTSIPERNIRCSRHSGLI